MQLAKVIGQVVSTVKEPGLVSFKILILQDIDPSLPDLGHIGISYVAIDLVGAGEGEVVVSTRGSAARVPPISKDAAVDNAVIAIVDSITINGNIAFQK